MYHVKRIESNDRYRREYWESGLNALWIIRPRLRWLTHRCALAGCLIALVFALAMTSDTFAQTPTEALFQAVELNDLAAVEIAIENGADLTEKNPDGMTPADVAVDLGHFRIAHLLLAKRTADPPASRITENAKQALTSPRARVSSPATSRPRGTSRLASVVAPVKPTPPSLIPEAEAPQARPTPVPASEAPTPAIDSRPRPDDEIAQSTPDEVNPPPASSGDAPAEEGGILSGIWGGIKSVATLGGLLGGDTEAPADGSRETQENYVARDPQRSSPADRFSADNAATGGVTDRSSSAGRMVERMTGIVGDRPPENEFGLPTEPVVPPVSGPDGNTDLAELAPPLPPLDDSADTTVTLPPGISTTPAEPIDIPGDSGSSNLPPLAAPEFGEVIEPEMPGLVPPVESNNDLASELEIPGLPSEAEVPGLEAPSGEVPGIIAPPGDDLASDIPGLPPGLEPLEGSNTGALRRPGGLLQPEDTNVLPPPISSNLQDRLNRIDAILNRNPEQSERGRIRLGQRGTGQTPSTAPEKAPVSSAPADPLLEIPKGLDTGPLGTPNSVIRRDPEAILRGARERAAKSRGVAPSTPVKRELPGVRVPRKPTPDGHQLLPPSETITMPEAPSTRFIDRLAKISRKPYQKDDIHGLPVVRRSADGTTPPREAIGVEKVPDPRRDKADDRIYKLARFFRGNQEEVSGMQPPERENVETEPLPRVIDNLVPEDDPARGKVVGEEALDLTGVEITPPASRRSSRPVTSPPTRQSAGALDENFLNRLTTVLQPREQPPPPDDPVVPPGQIGLNELDIRPGEMVPIPKPDIPDPWTMTVEKSDQSGETKTLGVTAVSPEDGSALPTEDGVVSKMVGRIRELLVGPRGADGKGDTIKQLDEEERQGAAERLLSEALRDGAPAALPDAGAWQVTEVETGNAPPGVPPKPREGALTRTSLENVVLSLGESVTLENTLPPQQNGLDPLNACVKKNRGTTLFCVEPIDWPQDLRSTFTIPTILYTGPMAITRYDQGLPSRFHSLFDSNEFEKVVAYYQSRYGEPTEIWKRSIAPLAQPRTDNPTVTWRSRDASTNVISVLEIRKFDDTRGGFPDTNRGAVMLYQMNAPTIFPQVSSHELMRLRRTR